MSSQPEPLGVPHSPPGLTIESIAAIHHEKFGGQGQAFTAPARVNLIGEHTDYTGGLVLPMAIDFETIALATPRSDRRIRIYSENFRECLQADLDELAPHGKKSADHRWVDYPVGVAWSLEQAGVRLPGFDMTVGGDVPLGSGLSSSASIEVATAFALLHLAGAMLPGREIATLARRAENEYVGASSGIMDQFVITNATAGRALLLDCRSLEFELLPLPPETRIVVVNSMVKHSVATGEYGDRRGEVDHGQQVLRERFPQVHLLRDANLQQLEAARAEMGENSYHRCRHIITENARVLQMRTALGTGERARIGQLMAEAHASFRDDFAASCPEVDLLVELAAGAPGCIGSRITGGGFGGCTVNLVEAAEANAFTTAVRQSYREATGLDAEAFVCTAVDGGLARAQRGS